MTNPTPEQTIQAGWEWLEANYGQFWCVTSLSWESPLTLIVTMSWDASGSYRMTFNKDLTEPTFSATRSRRKERRAGQYGPI